MLRKESWHSEEQQVMLHSSRTEERKERRKDSVDVRVSGGNSGEIALTFRNLTFCM